MNRRDYEAEIHASALPPTARLVALVVGSFGNWTEDREVWPSVTTVADRAGISRRQAQRHITKLREDGWLRETGRKHLNVAVYELASPVETSVETQVSQLRDGPEESVETLKVISRDTEGVSRDTEGNQLRHGCLTNLKEPKEKNLKEVKEMNTEDSGPKAHGADAPVDESSSLTKKTNPLILLGTGGTATLKQVAALHNASDSEIEDAADLLRRGQVQGWSFTEKCRNALTKVGVNVDDDW